MAILRILNFVKFYHTPTSSFRDKFSFWEHTCPRDKHFAFGRIIEVVSFSFLRISHKDAFIRLGSKLVSDLTSYVSLTTPNPHERHTRTPPSPYLIWCLLNRLGWNTVKCESGC